MLRCGADVMERQISIYPAARGCKGPVMLQTVEIPLWLFVVILLFAAVTFASHFLFPSVRWFFRRRFEKAVARLNKRLTRPIEPFKLARRHDMIQRLIYDPEVSKAIVRHARNEGVPENVAFEEAQKYAREIVPSFSAFTYFGFAIRVARWLANLLYSVRTPPENDRVFETISSDTTVVFVMNHRSNMDYVLVTYLAAQASALSYAVGEWARVWPLSRLIKSMGAYFIRRKSRNALYLRVLARYVHMATEGGATQAVFPEGGLSVDGRLMSPKTGILSYIVRAWDPDGPDVAFVPVAINYDRVLEDRVLIAAGQRGDRRFGAKVSVIFRFILEKLWLKLRGKFTRFGTAAVVFGTPVMLSSYGQRPETSELANDLMGRIRGHMPVLGVPLVASVLLSEDQPLPWDAIAQKAHARLMASGQWTDVKEDPAKVIDKAKDRLIQRGFIQETPDGWCLNAQERDTLAYYANSIAHHFDLPPFEISARAKS